LAIRGSLIKTPVRNVGLASCSSNNLAIVASVSLLGFIFNKSNTSLPISCAAFLTGEPISWNVLICLVVNQ